jgi:hypothetical protein
VSDAKFNSVAIFDAISEGELNTARHLREDLMDIAEYIAHGLDVRYFRVDSADDMESCISVLLGEATEHGLIPWGHIEGHGSTDESGFRTVDTHILAGLALKDLSRH